MVVPNLEATNNEMQMLLLLRQRETLLKEREDVREVLLDVVEGLRAALDDVQRHREAEKLESSESREAILEERDAQECRRCVE